jgi:WD40 repeat protein
MSDHWGDLKDSLWSRVQDALDAGRVVRRTKSHAISPGSTKVIAYRDPDTGAERGVVETTVDEEGAHSIIEHPSLGAAIAAYEAQVRADSSEDFPFLSSDVPGVETNSLSPMPREMVQTDDGGWMHELDYEQLYGVRTSGTRLPGTPPAASPSRVRAMTAEPRDWAPGEARFDDITPASWRRPGVRSRLNDLALLVLADGRRLLASSDRTAGYVWSARDGSPLETLVGHSEAVFAVAMVPLVDGRVVLATGGQEGLARMYMATESDFLGQLETPDQTPVNAMALVSPPGEVPWLVTGGDEAVIRVWTVGPGREVAELKVGEPQLDVVWSIAATVLADGHVCVVASAYVDMDTVVYVWDVTASELLHELRFETPSGYSGPPKVAVVTLADRSFRFAATNGSTVRVWDGRTGDVVRMFCLPDAKGSGVAMVTLPDLRVVLAALGGDRAIVWDLESGAELGTVMGDAGFRAIAMASTEDGHLLLALGGEDFEPARLLRMVVSPGAQ